MRLEVPGERVSLPTVNALVNELMDLPTLPEVVAELRGRLAQEQAARQQFYEQVPDGAKWEFIQGQVVMHSPDKVRHIEVRQLAERTLSAYAQVHAAGIVLGGKALCVFPRNDFMPDVAFFGPTKAARLRPQQFKLPVPDLAVEVLSKSTAARDRGIKFQDYQAHGVGEYWIVDADRDVIEQYVLERGEYTLAMKSGSGELRSRVVNGFRVAVRALFDPAENLEALRTILGNPRGRH